MIALNEVRAELTPAAGWCDIVHPAARGMPFYGQVFLLNSGGTTVTPMAVLRRSGQEAERINAPARVCLELIGYPPVTNGTHPQRMEATLVKVVPRSHHDRAPALRFFSVPQMT